MSLTEQAAAPTAIPSGANGAGGGGRPLRPAKRVAIQHPKHGEPGGVRTFGIVVLIGFGLIGGFLHWRGFTTAPSVLWGLGAAVCVLALVAPGPAKVVQRGWMAAAGVLGYVNTTILLTLFHFVCFGGLSLAFKLMGRDALKLKLDRGATTYWEKKSVRTDPQSYFSQF